jgi:hypothetical protein
MVAFRWPTLCLIFGSLVASGVAQTTPAGWKTAFQNSYGINLIYTTTSPSAYSLTYNIPLATDATAQSAYMQKAYEQIGKYTANYRTHMQLTKVVVCYNLAVGGQYRAAVPDPANHTLFLDYKSGVYNPDYQRHVVNHELFHYIMGIVKGNMYWQDATFGSYNYPGFQYGTGGANAQNPNYTVLNHPYLGFVNMYATSGMEEDMAEIDAMRFVPNEAANLASWRTNDSYLNNKVNRLLQILAPYQ